MKNPFFKSMSETDFVNSKIADASNRVLPILDIYLNYTWYIPDVIQNYKSIAEKFVFYGFMHYNKWHDEF